MTATAKSSSNVPAILRTADDLVAETTAAAETTDTMIVHAAALADIQGAGSTTCKRRRHCKSLGVGYEAAGIGGRDINFGIIER